MIFSSLISDLRNHNIFDYPVVLLFSGRTGCICQVGGVFYIKMKATYGLKYEIVIIYSHSVSNNRWTSGVLLVYVVVRQTVRSNSALFLIIYNEI